MKLVMTLLVRDEADIIDAQIAFHLNAGVDFVIATDNGSRDDTREILDSYAQDGFLYLLDEPRNDYREREWISRMARLAATRFGADWVINSAADEFWWPRWASLHEVLDAVPERFGVVPTFIRHFVPRPPDGRHFAERMTVRLAPQAPINDPLSPFRSFPKVVHRADPRADVSRGSHVLLHPSFECLRTWHPIEVLHFPIRTPEQSAHKARLQWDAFATSRRTRGTGKRANAYRAFTHGLSREHYDSLTVDDETLARGLAEGSLVIDTRVRDSLGGLRVSRTTGSGDDGLPAARRRQFAAPTAGAARIRLPQPGLVEDMGVAVDVAVLAETQWGRRLKQLDALEARLLAGSRPASADG